MYQLSRYCIGTIVTILDSVNGFSEVDLGELMWQYTQINLDVPSYTIPGDASRVGQRHYHNVAGFLGVYGNIATATYIHGIVMSMLHNGLDECNVAGDDGLNVTGSVEHTLRVVSHLGIVADEKTFRDSEGSCIHLKRPILRVGGQLRLGSLVPWPSLEIVQNPTDFRYPHLSTYSTFERLDMLSSSITAFLRSLESRDLDEKELGMIDHHLTWIYSEYRLPREGCVPQVTRVFRSFVPAYERRYIGICPITNTIERHYQNIVVLPERGEIDELESELLQETEFRSNSTRMLRHLTALGYLVQEKVQICVYGYDGLQALLKEYLDPEPIVYSYTVTRELPRWASK